MEKYLEATEDALIAAFCEELDVLGGEEAEGFDMAEDMEVAWGYDARDLSGGACFQSTRCWEVCQTRVSDSAVLGLGFFVRSGSRILRCLVGWSWLRCADTCRLVRVWVFVVFVKVRKRPS